MENLKEKIIAITIAFVLIGVMVPIGLTTFYDNPIGTSVNLNEGVMFEHSVDVEFDNNDRNVTINKPYNTTINTLEAVNNTEDLNNSTINVEDSTTDDHTSMTVVVYMSFICNYNAQLNNVTCYFDSNLAEETWIYVYLIKSYWDIGNSRSKPVSWSNESVLLGQITVIADNWYTLDTNHTTFLNPSTTENNTWFIGCLDSSTDVRWDFDSNDGVDEGYAYIDTTYSTNDYLLKIGVAPVERFADIYFTYWESDHNVELEFFVDWYEYVINVTISETCEYPYTILYIGYEASTQANINLTMNFSYDDYPFYLNITYNRNFNLLNCSLNETLADYTDSSGITYITANNGNYTIFYLFSTELSNMYNVIPIFMVIAIVLIFVYEIKKHNEE